MQNIIKWGFLCVFLIGNVFYSCAQHENISSLKIEQIMQGDKFVGHLPDNLFWARDNSSIYFDWNPENAESDSSYQYQLNSGSISKVDSETRWNLLKNKLVYSKDKSKALFEKRGDIFLMFVSENKVVQVTKTNSRESNPHFTFADSKVAYRAENNLYTWDISSGQIEQITDFSENSKEHRPGILKDNEKWIQDDQLELFSVLKERERIKELREAKNEMAEADNPLTIFLEGKSIMNLQISPDGRYVSYILYKRPKSENTNVPNYVTKSGYTEEISARPKVGSEPTEYQLFIYDIMNRKSTNVDFGSLLGIKDLPEYLKDYPDKKHEKSERVGFINGPFWNNKGTLAFIEMRANDNKDRWIALLDFETGKLKQLERQHDDAWIDGPGIGYFSRYDNALGWMPDDKNIWFQSEETGYSHLYVLDIQSKKKKALTRGKFEIFNPFISKDNQYWYFSSNEVHPGEVQFYRMPIEGRKAEQLTKMTGSNLVFLSPDERKMAIRHSFSNKPWEIYLKDNPALSGKDETAVQITSSTSDEFRAYQWKVPEIITFKASDGEIVYARLYKPTDDTKNNAAIIFVHGAGYLQNAHKWWSSYFREYMFHNMLVDNGFTVLDIDYRGSAGYGRDWRTGIYRHMGGKDLSDQVDGAKYLVNNLGINENKIGIYGGSYGGFITIMAMFKAADTFKAGAAIRSVTDWAHYNHGYTSNILNTPTTDSLAYRRSSPIYYAEGLKGHLLMLHGMIDDNVHFQDVVRLSQRLIELGKKNWDIAIYPVERHAFVEPSSWTDEYTRIFNLFRETLLKE